MAQSGNRDTGQFGIFFSHDNAIVDLMFFACGGKFYFEHGIIISAWKVFLQR